MPYLPATHALLRSLRWRVRCHHGPITSFAIGLTWLAWASIVVPLAVTAAMVELIVAVWEAERA